MALHFIAVKEGFLKSNVSSYSLNGTQQFDFTKNIRVAHPFGSKKVAREFAKRHFQGTYYAVVAAIGA